MRPARPAAATISTRIASLVGRIRGQAPTDRTLSRVPTVRRASLSPPAHASHRPGDGGRRPGSARCCVPRRAARRRQPSSLPRPARRASTRAQAALLTGGGSAHRGRQTSRGRRERPFPVVLELLLVAFDSHRLLRGGAASGAELAVDVLVRRRRSVPGEGGGAGHAARPPRLGIVEDCRHRCGDRRGIVGVERQRRVAADLGQ